MGWLSLEVRYKTKQLEKVCTSRKEAVKKYNDNMAEKIFTRIGQIEATDSIDDLVKYSIGRCHSLSGNRNNQFAMDLVQPFRLVFINVGDTVHIAQIIEITDYH